MRTPTLLGALLLCGLSSLSCAYAEDAYEDALAAYQEANAAQDPHHSGYAQAYRIWTDLAAQGNPAAVYHLGVLHLYGLGGASFDLTRGHDLVRQAAEGGFPQAQAYMGVLQEKGDGLFTRIDADAARAWYEKAAAAGHCYSVRRLTRAHAGGELGMEIDEEASAALRASRPECYAAARSE